MLINYPASIKPSEFIMMINDDDMNKEQAGVFATFLRSKGFEVTRSKRYSTTKCLAWYTFKFKKEETFIRSYGTNIKMCEKMVQMFLAKTNG